MAEKKPEVWLMRTYSGHSTAKASNELYRKNLTKGQTGLSVAFDLPTQTGYDSDHPLAIAEVGKVGVPISHIENMRTLFDGIPLEQTNTSMTINATAPWLLSLYIAAAESQGANIKLLSGTTQNDILKEYLSRGTYIFPPEHSIRLTTDIITYTVEHLPKWNPVNVCPYHLQEAGATPVQELAYGLANAICFLDSVQKTGNLSKDDFERSVGRISFFMDSNIHFVEEICKVRAFVKLWEEITKDRYVVSNASYRRFRYGVQVNSLGLTERQPENNVQRIILEMLGVTLSKNARARAIQLPCWNEALGLPRPWDQQWSLRIQQVLALETDLLEYEDIFDGSKVIETKTNQLIKEARAELKKVLDMGGAAVAIDYMKQQLVAANTKRVRQIEEKTTKVVGVNCYTETESSPLTTSCDQGILKINPDHVKDQIKSLAAFRKKRNAKEINGILQNLKDAAKNGGNIMPASIAAAKAGVTTGEWANCLREIFGEYRGPTGIASGLTKAHSETIEAIRKKVAGFKKQTGEVLRILVGKPGLDGHSNGAEQIAVRARDVGMEVIYQGIRLTPIQIVDSALEEGVHVIGLSILSGSHLEIIPEILRLMREKKIENIPVIAGGIIPESDKKNLLKQGVARVYTPKDYDLNQIMSEIVDTCLKRYS
ncbi:MAG: protein meaA [Deltaproteobacteria bacterium RIFCSPLOWO2_12_FULL_40_28]|nr:MAG: protein meaA [Deltaproteobacteria bacterium RIFCSPHIGHO2_02_FULL_40_28]OGQ19323.1 MAG: protein meaA [Deltaproteobacteria bacterium RIFCSPHIGHO2_12_FULL_40_32]OGQ40453.1 MAG: protein meaA [Deltaproteobacteria bacterium RIFCSPLOWO2_02_FULL_40_36]OGQ53689.1 MAG: protein meaA [Deltaproteobacteria bacterium RIFCSPLOWO2_12_FULL_40_28]